MFGWSLTQIRYLDKPQIEAQWRNLNISHIGLVVFWGKQDYIYQSINYKAVCRGALSLISSSKCIKFKENQALLRTWGIKKITRSLHIHF